MISLRKTLPQQLTQFVRFVAGQMRHARPRLLCRCSEQLKNLVQLIVRIPDARKRRHAGDHLDEYATNAPHVQRRRVVGAAEQNVCSNGNKMRLVHADQTDAFKPKLQTWRPIPQRHHLVRVRVTWHTLGARQPKIGQLQFAALADQQILRLDVAMQDASLVAVRQTAQQLEQEEAHVAMIEAAAVPFHVLRQVGVLGVQRERL